MGLSRNTARIAGGKRDSPLFCTPPAGERPSSIGGIRDGYDTDVKDLTSSGDALYEDPAPANHRECTYGHQILRTFDLDKSYPQAATTVDLKFPIRQGNFGERYTDMAPSGRSLTSSAVPLRSGQAPERHYLAHGITSEPHQVRTSSLNPISTSVATSDSGPIKHLQSLGQLTGYATSEDDEKKNTVQRIKKPMRTKKTIYKSAEFVDTESSSQSEDDHKVQCPEIQVDEPSKRLQIRRPLASNKLNLQTPSAMPAKRRESIENTTNGGTPKKRPLSPNVPVSVSKRPATKGGFVVSSDESEDDADDDEPKQSKSVAQQPPRPLTRLGSMQNALRTTPAPASSPAKQVNRTRLNMLLGRNRSATPAPRQSLPPGHLKGALPRFTGSAAARGVSALPQVPRDQFLQRNQTQNADESQNTGKIVTGGKEMENLEQQSVAPKPRKTTPRITGKASSNILGNARSMTLDELPALVTPKVNSNAQPVRPATVTITSSDPQVQQRRPAPAANTISGGGGSSAKTKKDEATQPRSLLKAKLDDTMKPVAGASSDTNSHINGDNRQKQAQDSPFLPSGTSRVPTKPPPSDASGPAAPRSGTSPGTQAFGTSVPKVVKAQPKHQDSTPTQKQQLSNVMEEASSSSNSASSAPAQLSQKCKADNMSDKAGDAAVTASKKLASSPFNTVVKPSNDATTTSPLPVTRSGQPARDDGQFNKADAASSATTARNLPPVVANQSSEIEAKGSSNEASFLSDQTASNSTAIIPHASSTTITSNKTGQKQIVPNSSVSNAKIPPNSKPESKPHSTAPARPEKDSAASEVVLTPPVSPLVAGSIAFSSAASTSGDIFVLSQPPKPLKEAEPYFEYSVFHKHWFSGQEEKDGTTTEVTVRPSTNIDEANAQADKMFQSSQLCLQYMLVESSTKRDDNGCAVFTSHISPFDYPSKKSHIKIWVQRDAVSKYANRAPQSFKGTSFISSTGYVLRLFKLIASSESDSESSSSDSASDSDGNAPHEPIRVYHPHGRPEVYTTVAAANRAAKSLQIELSHEKDPKDAMTKTFQQKDLEKLNAKVLELKSAGYSEEMCWRSKFNACGMGGDSLELMVEKAGICGPRNM